MRKVASLTADDLDAISSGVSPKPKGKMSAAEFDKISQEYSAPEPREKPTTVASFDDQKAAAEFAKDLNLLFSHGASQGFSDEALAAIKTQSVSSPEYLFERDTLRKGIEGARERNPIAAPITEAVGSMASTAAVPVLKGYPVFKELVSAGLQGAGEAPEMSDVPLEASKSTAITGALTAGGKVLKNVMFDDPTKIMTRSLGLRGSELKQDVASKPIKAVQRLEKAGFFKQGVVGIPKGKFRFERSAKSLPDLFQPQTLDTLVSRAEQNISVLAERNKEILKGKKVPSIELKRSLYEAVQDFTADPKGFDVEKRYELARDLIETVEKDLKYKAGWAQGKPIDALDVEKAKQSLDEYLRDAAFEKKAMDLGVGKQGILELRTKLDELLDVSSIGGEEYRKNNDLMSDLYTVTKLMRKKEARDYVDTGAGMVDVRGGLAKFLEGISPTPVDILRSDISSISSSAPGKKITELARRATNEKLTTNPAAEPILPESYQEQVDFPAYDFSDTKRAFPAQQRKPNMVSTLDMTPMEIQEAQIPRTTQGVLQNKELLIAKLTMSEAPDQMIKTVAHALDKKPGAINGLMQQVALAYPGIFQDSKYSMFDGYLLDSNDRAKAADETSKRDDLNSLQKAKIINELNKSGKWLGE